MGNSFGYRAYRRAHTGVHTCPSSCVASCARYSHLLHFLTEHHSSSQGSAIIIFLCMERTEVSSGPLPKGSCSLSLHLVPCFAGILLIPCPVTAVPSRVSRFFIPCQESSPGCWLCLPRLWDQHSDMPGSQEFMDLIQQPEPLTPQHPDKMNTALLWCLQGMEVELLCEERV